MKLFATPSAATCVRIAGLSCVLISVRNDGSNPSKRNPKLDAILSAPANHRVIFENDDIRVLSVTVKPGEMEKITSFSD